LPFCDIFGSLSGGESLRKYCGMDTEAMMLVLEVLGKKTGDEE